MTTLTIAQPGAGLESRTADRLRELCAHPDRHVGGPGNRAALALFEQVVTSCELAVEAAEVDGLAWDGGRAELWFGDEVWPAHPSPYTRACDAMARLRVARTVEELEGCDATGAILLLSGEIAREQLVPKRFPFFESPGSSRILAALEARPPAGVIAATGRGSGFAGGQYPFPLIDDGDVDIPSACVTDVVGEELRAFAGRTGNLRIESERRPGRSRHLVARMGPAAGPRILVYAHIDSKHGSRGAIDNAAGVAALLALAELLAARPPEPGLAVELVPVNGEDDYANAGERRELERNAGRWQEVVLGINLDGIGSWDAPTAISTYGATPATDAAVGRVLPLHPRVVPGEPWYEGDHGLFLMHERPALAVTSADIRTLASTVTHTDRDRLELVDPARIVDAARFLADLVSAVAETIAPAAPAAPAAPIAPAVS